MIYGERSQLLYNPYYKSVVDLKDEKGVAFSASGASSQIAELALRRETSVSRRSIITVRIDNIALTKVNAAFHFTRARK